MATCDTTDCGRPIHNKKRSLCKRCYTYWYRHQRELGPCSVDGCELHAATRGFCRGHYHRPCRYGDPLPGSGRGSPGRRRGIRSLAGWYITNNGYRRMRREDGRREDEHRIVMRRIPGRELLPGESVHHRNGDKLDNRPQNPELWVRRQPTGQRVEDLVARAHEVLDRYGGIVDGRTHDQADSAVVEEAHAPTLAAVSSRGCRAAAPTARSGPPWPPAPSPRRRRGRRRSGPTAPSART